VSQFWSVFRATMTEFWGGRTKYIVAVLVIGWFLLFFFTTGVEVEAGGSVKVFKMAGVRIDVARDSRILGERFEKGIDFLCAIALIVSLQFFAFILVGVSSARNITSTLSKGMVEFVLSQPIPRWRYFLYKYSATVTFFSAVAFSLVLSNWLVGLIRLGEVSYNFLYSLVYILLLYGVLIALIYLVFGLTANIRATTAIPIVIVVVAGILHSAYKIYSSDAFGFFEEKVGWGMRAAVVFYHILPKIGELPLEGVSAIFGKGIAFSYPLWSTLIFGAAALLVAISSLCRRDY